jgi:preprotein translocase subunit YajC
MFKIGDKVVDRHGYKGVITNIFDTGLILVQQKPNVWCTYDRDYMLRKRVF